jgi:ATP-dependent Clp protease adapter protein ClpS
MKIIKELLEQDEDRVGVIDRPKEKLIPKKPKMYMCVLHNDAYTHAHRVVDILNKYFGHGVQAAMMIMLKAHREGKAPAGGPYSKDIAQSKATHAMEEAKNEEFPLLITVEDVPAD